MRNRLILAVVTGGLLLLAPRLHSQEADSTALPLQEQIMAQMEAVTEALDLNLDFSDLIDAYQYYAENKVNLNGDEVTELRNIYLINDFQLKNLLEYRKRYGPFLSVYELALVEGFDDQTLDILIPISTATPVAKKSPLKVRNIPRYGRHQLISRLERNLNSQLGYQEISDSALYKKPNSRYLGSKEKVYVKYQFNYRNRIRAGVTMDKDAGEVFFKKRVNDSLQRLLGDKLKNGFDFYSAHAYIADMGVLRSLAIGDYHLAFGQGLTLWSGLSFGKSTVPTQVMRYGSGVKPNTSVNESFFLRGGAATFGWKFLELSMFYSDKKVDARLSETDTASLENVVITSLYETGLHRTVGELVGKGVIGQQLSGGHLAFKTKKLEIGYTLHQTRLEASLWPALKPYTLFRLRADRLTNQGVDWKWVLPRFVFFGELSKSDNGGKAGLAGVQAQPAGFVSVTLLWRHFEKEYQNLFGNAFSESNSTNNESGLYAGVTASLAPGWKVSAYADYFRFDWLRFATDAPSNGFDYFVQTDYRINRNADLYFRFRSKQKMTNDNGPWNAIDFIVPERRNTYRLHFNYRVSRSFTLKNRAELVSYQRSENDPQYGFLIYQDIIYRPAGKPFDLNLRYALFDADSYDARLYAYESDVLYAFSIPAFSGKGSRVYLVGKYKITSQLDIQARLAHTWYDNKVKVGSGLEEIDGNSKTDFKLQLRWKF